MSGDQAGGRYWQNWDRGEAAKRIDAYWLAEEGAYRTSLVADLRACFGKRVPLLEVGCGTGLIYGELRRQGVVTAASYQGGDVSRSMLDIARQRFPAARFGEMDIFSLPFADRSQRNVICIHVLQHLPAYDQALRELLRVTGERLYLASWFIPGQEDELVFSEPSERWDGQSFHNNAYALAGFLTKLVAAADREIADLHVRHVGGRNYTICVLFAQPGAKKPPVMARIKMKLRLLLSR